MTTAPDNRPALCSMLHWLWSAQREIEQARVRIIMELHSESNRSIDDIGKDVKQAAVCIKEAMGLWETMK